MALKQTIAPYGSVVNNPNGFIMKENNGDTLGDRLRQLRGDITQQAFADLLGIGLATWRRYENNDRTPDIELAARLNMMFSVDLLWLLTGKEGARATDSITPRESRLLAAFRMADEQGKLVMESMSQALIPSATKFEGSQQTFNGQVGDVAGRDIINKDKNE